jgi:glycosyltransferase involved in cell wall biosynthesis
MKVAIVHDWLTGMRGGEKVLEVLCELYPEAHLYTLIHNKGSVSETIEGMDIRTSFIQRLPFTKKHYRYLLPLFPSAIESFDLNGYDLVISSSHCVAKGVLTPPECLHISYIHTPMRYIWDLYNDYFTSLGWLRGTLMALVAHYLRVWDVASSKRPDHFVANSKHVASRVEKYYGKDATVIYPPVNCEKFHVSDKVEDYYLVVSAFAPYKRIDIAIEAFNSLELPLKVIGGGQEDKRLRAIAKANIEFLGKLDDATLSNQYSRCKALIFPGIEDFGIVPLEAMASGRPVIAYSKGGALESVVPPRAGREPTGMLFDEQTPEALKAAIRTFEDNIDIFRSEEIRRHAAAFDRPRFKKKIRTYIEKKLKEFRKEPYAERKLKAL